MRISDWSSDVCSSDLYLVPNLLGRRLEEEQGEIAIILHVQIRPQLGAAEDPDLAVRDGVVGEDVYRKVQPQPGGVSANRRRAEGDAHEILVGVAGEQGLAHALVFVLEGQRDERVVLGHVRGGGNAIDETGGGVEEPFTAGRLREET